MTNVCFLDIDGPMIPVKAFYLPNQTKIVRIFDPCAVGMLNDILKHTSSQLVISSTHRLQGYEYIVRLLSSNGIDPKYLHVDWHTTMITTTRTREIQQWLDDHIIDNYIAIDDETLEDTIVSTKCCGYNGFSMTNMLECKLALGYHDKESVVDAATQRQRIEATLNFLKS